MSNNKSTHKLHYQTHAPKNVSISSYYNEQYISLTTYNDDPSYTNIIDNENNDNNEVVYIVDRLYNNDKNLIE